MNINNTGIYYSLNELMSRHYTINMICGTRNAGKSTAVQKYAIKRAINYYNQNKTGSQFAMIVRYDTNCKLMCDTYFNNTMEQFYPDYEMKYSNRKFYLKHKKQNKKTEVGYAFALNKASDYKSSSYPHINTILFEEFLNIKNQHISNKEQPELEVELLLSIWSTIARGAGKKLRDDVRCFLVANCYYINNPFFRYFKLIDDIVKNPFQRFYIKGNKPKVLLEITHQDLNLNFTRDGIATGTNFVDMQNELKIINKPIVNEVLFQLTLDNREFLNVARYNDGIIVFSNRNKIRNNVMVFSCSDIKRKGIYNIKTFKALNQYKMLSEQFNNNWLYYDSIQTYIYLYDILAF